jgi:SAM-dependent methyltransferase
VKSYFWTDVPLGQTKDGARCEDLRRLTFPDGSFDLIISAEVLEHVFDLPDVLREIARVLKPGGLHVFTIPNRYPFPATSFVRAVEVGGEVEHRVALHYHIAGDGSKSLVVTDFGAELADQHAAAGLRLSIIRRSAPSMPEHQNATFVARRIPGAA